jgi:hypothetical protein
MAFVAGHNTVISLDNAAGTPTNISTYVDSISGFDLGAATLDVTSFTNSAQNFILGLDTSPAVSISGSWDSTLDTLMSAAKATKTAKTLRVSYAGTAGGTNYVEAEVFITAYSGASSVADKVTWNASLQVTGAVSTGTN